MKTPVVKVVRPKREELEARRFKVKTPVVKINPPRPKRDSEEDEDDHELEARRFKVKTPVVKINPPRPKRETNVYRYVALYLLLAEVQTHVNLW